MTGFELRTSGIRSECSTNWATTTAQHKTFFPLKAYSHELHLMHAAAAKSAKWKIYFSAEMQPSATAAHVKHNSCESALS